MEAKNIQGGLVKLPRDSRDFKLGFVFTLPKLEDLPNQFQLTPLTIKDQGQTDYCTAYATAGASELQEGVELYPEWVFAASKEITGDNDDWGQDIRAIYKAHVKYGIPEMATARETDLPKGNDARYLKNYNPLLTENAGKHKKQSFFEVSHYKYDRFDAIRAAIYHFRDKKQAVGMGLIWTWDLQNSHLKGTEKQGFGHMVYAVGWWGDELVIVNSYSKDAGYEGLHYVSRETINTFVKDYGAFMGVDMPKEEAKKLNARGEWYYASLFARILIMLRRLWQ